MLKVHIVFFSLIFFILHKHIIASEWPFKYLGIYLEDGTD